MAAVLVHSVATSLASQPVPQHPWWSEHATVVAEGLNGLFDMFSEEDKDHVFVQLDLLPKLRAFSPLIRTKVGWLAACLLACLLQLLRLF